MKVLLALGLFIASLLIVLLVGFGPSSNGIVYADGENWLGTYSYRKQITINGSSGGAQNPYTLDIYVHNGSGSDSTNHVYTSGNSIDFPHDIRFTDSDGSTLIDFWIEEPNFDGYSDDPSRMWVEFTNVPASPSTKNFYIYYGLVSQTTTSNGYDTFMFYDDFRSVDFSEWTTETEYGATWSGATTNAVTSSLGGIAPEFGNGTHEYAGRFAFRWENAYFQYTHNAGRDLRTFAYAEVNYGYGGGAPGCVYGLQAGEDCYFRDDAGANGVFTATGYCSSAWERKGDYSSVSTDTYLRFYLKDTNVGSYGIHYYALDVVASRYYVSPEPVIDSFGAEEETLIVNMDTLPATLVEESSATLWGNVTYASGNFTHRGFVWDDASHTDPGDVDPSATDYDFNWTESGNFSQGTFSHGITSLTKGQTYYARACINSSNGWDYGDTEISFITKPDEPTSFDAMDGSEGPIRLTWTNGEGYDGVEIWGKSGSYPSARGDGTLTYNGSASMYYDSNPAVGETWYYKMWSYALGSIVYSDSYASCWGTNYAAYSYGSTANDPPCSTEQKYEYYTTGGANTTAIYGDNWYAQTFTVGDTAHTVSKVRLKLYRIGTVGSVTVSIKDTTIAGHPDNISQDLISVTLDGDDVSTYSGGTWTEFDFTYPLALEASTKYAIVIGAPSAPDTSNAIYALYTINGTYGQGNYEYSVNGGVTWYSETQDDFLFEVWGEESFDICNVQMYRDYRESGDWLLTACYQCVWAPFSPDTDPQTCFSAQFLVDGDIKASIGMPLWGSAPVGIYLGADLVEHLEWGANNSVFRIVGTGACGGITEYTSESVTWVGSNLNMLDNWVLLTAGDMEEYYSIAFTTLSGSDVVLNEHGGAIFDIAIPYLCCERDHLYYMPCVCEPGTDFGGYYQSSLNWQSLLGPRVVAALNTTGGVVDISGKSVAQVGFLLIFAAIAVVTAVAVPEHKGFACVMLALPFSFIGWLTGIIPLAAAAVIASLAVVAIVWAIWLMRT